MPKAPRITKIKTLSTCLFTDCRLKVLNTLGVLTHPSSTEKTYTVYSHTTTKHRVKCWSGAQSSTSTLSELRQSTEFFNGRLEWMDLVYSPGETESGVPRRPPTHSHYRLRFPRCLPDQHTRDSSICLISLFLCTISTPFFPPLSCFLSSAAIIY